MNYNKVYSKPINVLAWYVIMYYFISEQREQLNLLIMKTLEIIEQRRKEAQKVKESGVIDRIQGNDTEEDELTYFDSYSENVAWSYKDQREQAEERFNSLKKDTGYRIDYSQMK